MKHLPDYLQTRLTRGTWMGIASLMLTCTALVGVPLYSWGLAIDRRVHSHGEVLARLVSEHRQLTEAIQTLIRVDERVTQLERRVNHLERRHVAADMEGLQ